MKPLFLPLFVVFTLMTLPRQAAAANVEPGVGYTNTFGSQPSAGDWATLSFAGGANDSYEMDLVVNSGVTAGAFIVAPTLDPANPPPPAASAEATWSSFGFYLQTRPTGNRCTVLMGKFVNATGTNATQVSISYHLTVPTGGVTEEAGKGTRVYYSLTGLTNSWTNLGALNNLANSGDFTLSTNLTVNWTNGGNLYLVWVDDNATGNPTDSPNIIDDFSLNVTAGVALVTTLTLRLDAPANSAVLLSGLPEISGATIINGTAPFTVEYFTNSGVGNLNFASAGSSGTGSYPVDLGVLVAGNYSIYAVVTDSAATPNRATSATNAFSVIEPIAVTLTSPADQAVVDNVTRVRAAGTVSGGSAPYSLQFSLDGVAAGPALTGAPYELDLGTLFVGDHALQATVTDAKGWVSNSVIHTVHVTGPLGVMLHPTNGTSFLFGQKVALVAAPGGGTAPYLLNFLTNGQLAATLSSPTDSVDLGILPVGTYTGLVQVVDSTLPVAQQEKSTENVFRILPNPVVVSVTGPTNGQNVTSGVVLTLNAAAIVQSPLLITNMEFFYDGVATGADNTPPYAASVASPTQGNHSIWAVATDSLGRRVASATNQINVLAPQGSNNNFANAIPLSGPIVTSSASNVGANREFGEPQHGGNRGGASIWWSWTATASGPTTIDTMGSTFNTLLGVYTGTLVNQLTTVAGNNDFEGNQYSRVQFNAVGGTVYRIAVDGFRAGGGGGGGQTATGTVILHIQGVGGLALDTPTDGMVFTVGDPIPVNVSFDGNFPNPPATRVDFYVGGNLFASSTTAPFSAVATNVPAGSNTVQVVAFDSLGMPVQSPVSHIFVQRIGVTLLTPFEDTLFTSTNPIIVTAWAYLPSGTITTVDFFADGVKIGEDSTAPYSAEWTNAPGGSHRLTAIGRSDAGGSYGSQTVNIGVADRLIPLGAVWKFLDDGSNQGTNWIAINFDDSGWTNGPAELGYGDGDEATVVNSGPAGNFYITTYFRRSFIVSNAQSFLSMAVALERDDAGVVYLNGREVFRSSNLPPLPEVITNTTLATGFGGEDTIDSFTLSPTNFVDGVNVLAVEIHQQDITSSDISFNLSLTAIPAIIHNQLPLVTLLNPTNNSSFVGPTALVLEASASDGDGTVTRVEFFSDLQPIGVVTNSPYTFTWVNPPVGAQLLTAVATDDQGGANSSEPVSIVVYDSLATPVGRVTSPRDGTILEGPTNLTLTATANALAGVTNVEFFVNGSSIGQDNTSPYQVVWTSSFGTNQLLVFVTDANGVQGMSPISTLVVTIPPTNTVAPTIKAENPAAFATVTNLTRVSLTFSEIVQNVDAEDLLVNGVPATGLTGGGSNYVFTFPQPVYGDVEITWAPDNGITDYGYPSPLPFNGLTAQWQYELADVFPPRLIARTPPAGVTLSNFTEVSVTFSEPVVGVDAADLLINGVPAYGLTGAGSNYLFAISQPPSGPILITWASEHGIKDLARVPNLFNATATGATWGLTFDSRITLVESNATWKFIKGRAEASIPTNAWRQLGFDDSSWSNAPAPFYLLDPYGSPAYPGTSLFDMAGNYSSIYLRHEFVVTSRSSIASVQLNAQSDDGFIAWINGNEVLRYNFGAGEPRYNSTASSGAPEPAGAGAAYINHTLTNAQRFLVTGTNVLTVQAFNLSLVQTDFGFNAQLFVFTSDAGLVAPTISEALPAVGDLFHLTNIVVTFSESVTNVDAGDLLVNGIPATDLVVVDDRNYNFGFAQPPYGPVVITWVPNHGIVDLDETAKPFNGTLTSSVLHYFLINPSNPTIVSKSPGAGTTITNLTSISVTFNEAVTGLDAADLLINGAPADAVSSTDAITHVFTFVRPPYGPVLITWATNHGIQDLEIPGNQFDPLRFGGQWKYTLVDPVPTVSILSPTSGSLVLAPADITIYALANDNDGTIARVEFLEGLTKLGEATTSPYTLLWSNVLAGDYILRAVATDNSGLIVTSAPVSIMVVTSFPIALVRGPYLQIGSSTGGVVRWRTDLVSDGSVFYGVDPTNLTEVALESTITNEHIVWITGLEPATKYYYSIGSSSQRLVGGSNYWFVTSPVTGTRKPSRLWVLGDSGTANNNARAVRDAYENYVATNRPADLMLMLGDNAYNAGTDAEHQAAIFDMYPSTLQNHFLWTTLGNHETDQSTTAETFPYLDIFSLPMHAEAGGIASGTEKYYSFDYANIHFVCLDSMTSGRTGDTPMAQWLKTDLAETTQDWIIAFFHHPPYTKGSHNSDAENDLVQIRQNILPILETNGVDLVLSGHSHCYERSFLLNGHYGLSTTFTSAMKVVEGDGRMTGTGAYMKNEAGQGVVYSVAGSSGQISGGTLNHPAHFVSLNQLGSLIIDVDGDQLDMSFLTSLGTTNDHVTLRKRVPGGPTAPLDLIASVLDSQTIALSWSDHSTNETGFLVERSLDGTNFVALLTTDANVTNLTDSALLPNTTYYYRVAAAGAGAPSEFTSIVSATTMNPAGTPLPPSDLIASADNGQDYYRSQIILRWRDRSANESGFLVERSVDGSEFIHIATVGANMTRYVDRELNSATSYYYRVRSFNGLGSSTASLPAAEATHPQSDVVISGGTTLFHGGVEGLAPVSYQWQINGVPISGATNESYGLEHVMPWDEGAYSVVITDAAGREESNPAYLYVISAPLILDHPVSRTNNLGSIAVFAVTAVGDESLRYHWRHEGVLLGAPSLPTLTMENVQVTDQGSYDVVVENDFGVSTSQVARLVVNLPPFAAPDTIYRWIGQEVAVDVASLLSNDGDPEGAPITLMGVATNSSHGGGVRMSGRFAIYTPPAGYNDGDSYSYTIADPQGALASALVSIVISSNTAPRIAALPDVVASVMTPVLIRNMAADGDMPADKLHHSLGGGLDNAYINGENGLFVWVPTRAQGPSTNTVTLTVTDDGKPPLSDARSFVVIVKDYVEISIGSTLLPIDDTTIVPVDIFSSAALSRLSFELHYPSDRLNLLTVESLLPDLADFSFQTSGPGAVVLNFNARPGNVLQGSHNLARVKFYTLPEQSSGFAALTAGGMVPTRVVEGLEPSPLIRPGRVTVIGNEPLLESRFSLSGQRELILYGRAGIPYTIEQSSNPTDPTSWKTYQELSLTTFFEVQTVSGVETSMMFYRARK